MVQFVMVIFDLNANVIKIRIQTIFKSNIVGELIYNFFNSFLYKENQMKKNYT